MPTPKPTPIDPAAFSALLPEIDTPILAGLRPAKEEEKPRPKAVAEISQEEARKHAEQWIRSARPAIEGRRGESQVFGVACGLVKGFNLPGWSAIELLREWNQTCQPPFTEFELRRKIEEAERAPDQRPRGYHLRPREAIQTVDFGETESEPGPPETVVDAEPEEMAEPTTDAADGATGAAAGAPPWTIIDDGRGDPKTGNLSPPLDRPGSRSDPITPSTGEPASPESQSARPAPEAGAGAGAVFTVADLKPRNEGERREVSNEIDDPARVADSFIIANEPAPGKPGYRWWKGHWYRWSGSMYRQMDDELFDAVLFWFCEKQFYNDFYDRLNSNTSQAFGDGKVKKKKVTKGFLDVIKTALKHYMNADSKDDSEPFWIGKAYRRWSPSDIIPFRNRLVHLPSFTGGERRNFIKKTPRFFCTYSLDYPFNYDTYDGPIVIPPHLGGFAESAWPGDAETLLTFREMLGYLLTACTDMHKIFLMIGPPRCGKGTILRLIADMIGRRNVASCTFNGLSQPFGKQSLVGKTVAIFPDARLTGKTDVGSVAETILSISGEDIQEVNRKHKAQVTMMLNTRFIISSNVLPRLNETSGALVSRAIVLNFKESFLGREDKSLGERLRREIPLITRWAIDGWVSLRERGHFIQPKASQQMINDMISLTSPMNAFVADCLDVGPKHESDTKSLYEHYKQWCDSHGRDHIGDMPRFCADLRSVVPAISYGDPVRRDGDREAWSKQIRGVSLRPQADGTEGISWARPFDFSTD